MTLFKQVGNFLSTRGVLDSQQVLYGAPMNLGKRIQHRLDDMDKTRNWLLDQVEGLTPQALSNLIVRDSRRSEWDLPIAKALGVSVLWLVYGFEAATCGTEEPTPAAYQSKVCPLPKAVDPLIDEVVKIMETTDERGRLMALGAIKGALANYRPAVANPAS